MHIRGEPNICYILDKDYCLPLIIDDDRFGLGEASRNQSVGGFTFPHTFSQ